MIKYTEGAEILRLSAVMMNGIIPFPSSNIAFDIVEGASSKGIEAAMAQGGTVLLLPTSNPAGETVDGALTKESFCRIGIIARVISVRNGKKSRHVVCECKARASVESFELVEDHYECDVTKVMAFGGNSSAYLLKSAKEYIKKQLNKVSELLPINTDELLMLLDKINDAGTLADVVASSGFISAYEDKKALLYETDVDKRLKLLIDILEKQNAYFEYEKGLHDKVRARLTKSQRDFYLHEQMKVIRNELGEGGDSELDELEARIDAAPLSAEARNGLHKELRRLSKTPFGSAEYSVIENHIDLCLSLPWETRTRTAIDVALAERILDDDHYGLEKVKERILEFLAVRKNSDTLKGQIICLVGPPGTGKTSIASSVARAVKREFVRVSLGGIRDEAEIRGHRKTYIGAMPGRIITALQKAGVSNPVMLLDEIDKMSSDVHGDPTAAMLEVLDPEQNVAFRDHFVEYPFDLSDVFFIATANSLKRIPRPLIDRMEIIELGIYTRLEKLMIAKRHLIPKQLKRHGVNGNFLRFTDAAIYELIDGYTREAGVRRLEQMIAEVIRKCIRRAERGDAKSKRTTVTETNLAGIIGARKAIPPHVSDEDEIGAVTGLAYTEVGGDALEIEAVVTDGSGKLELTGSLGDVMKESARIAVTCARTVADEYGYKADFVKSKDVHIHVPDGAVPKDGPSAGITLCTALVSALSGFKVRHDIAMTGELSLRGKVLAIGGLKEKTMAAYQLGIRTIIIPKDNVPSLEEIDRQIVDEIEFIPCSSIREVLDVAVIRPQ
ncbi:MAG: endopeptidase La [Clostridia bacterium]|nr:endopeptidase La [Clostridia bacterium]